MTRPDILIGCARLAALQLLLLVVSEMKLGTAICMR
jgi:hypothetical protein